MLCFADLKKYKFTYVFGFPALHSESPWELVSASGDAASSHNSHRETLTPPESTALVDTVQTWRYSVDSRQYGFFLAKKVLKHLNKHSRSTSMDSVDSPASPSNDLDFTWVVGSLSNFEGGFFNGVSKENRFICFADPSTHEEYPGWMLRNLLILVRQRWNLSEAQILCYRDTPARRHEAKSVIFRIRCDQKEPSQGSDGLATMPKVTGWEKNASGKFTSRIVNLGDYLDPQRYCFCCRNNSSPLTLPLGWLIKPWI
jgi:ubiquitin-like modifier-activating enzyme ATG7